jgi:hypothetical protein
MVLGKLICFIRQVNSGHPDYGRASIQRAANPKTEHINSNTISNPKISKFIPKSVFSLLWKKRW